MDGDELNEGIAKKVKGWFTKKEENYELEPRGGKVKAKSETSPTSKLDTDRIDPILLENMFASEPILGGGIVGWQMLLEDAGYRVIAKKEKTQALIDELFQDTTLYDESIEKFPLHTCIFGNWWLEHIFGRKNNIVDFISVDPKSMQGFLKKYPGSTEIQVNGLGRPKAYELMTSNGAKATYIPNLEMSWRPWIQVTHTQLGLGMVEQAFRDSTLKENLEQARVQTAYDLAWKKPIVNYGSPIFPSNAQLESKAIRLAQDLADPDLDYVVVPASEMTVDYPPMVEMKDTIIKQLEYTTKLQAAVMQMPVPLLVQSGEGENQATLEFLLDWFEIKFKAFQRKMKMDKIVKNVIVWNEKKKNRDATIDWTGLEVVYGKLSDKAAKEFVMRIQRLAKTGLIDANDPDVKRKVDEALDIVRTSPMPRKVDDDVDTSNNPQGQGEDE
jgi:hypothetical protein